MHTSVKALLAAGWLAVGIIGCGGPAPDAAAPGQAAATGSKYLLSAEPAGAKDVAEVRKTSKTDEEVIIVGRVGGDVDPFVEGAAAFTLVDNSLKPCEDGCPTPWDYCCALGLPEKKAVIKIVDDQGVPVAEDSRQLLGLKPLATVVVRGKAKRDEAGNLTVLASGVYVKK